MHIAPINQQKWTAQEMCLVAVMSAVVFAATFVPKIPIPLGYAHLGDAAIFLIVLLAGARQGIWAGCIGSAFADLLGGFPLWIGPTILIKLLMALSFALIVEKVSEEKVLKSIRTFTALVVALLIMTAGYTIFGAVLYDSIEAGLSSAPGLLIESAVNIAAFYLAAVPLKGKVVVNR
ncbi:ECF transporter S component [uncultured Anaerovibrio sp.]|uniref:ECF transporter S component n=1 Tax=uncultured Anaerovibrio sp. TaxID=361586 RepID=UPI0026035009|nr:ECF transporter S component [uncultured Anaerovibrio sp.]